MRVAIGSKKKVSGRMGVRRGTKVEKCLKEGLKKVKRYAFCNCSCFCELFFWDFLDKERVTDIGKVWDTLGNRNCVKL